MKTIKARGEMQPSLPLITAGPKLPNGKWSDPPPKTSQDQTFFRITFPYPF